ncbi:MAG TPA: amylo-alpha-1,6-glucosidase [Candidatus Baltobacteraceae bacterium]|nr:amylo-alpha-1,6-glucosidase [Candidatus Baltobacteraceae bacterium]
MRASYDAQHNEYCAYVLPEAQTPYGLLLGNFKSFAQSTAKGGIRGLWDADTDQIIFGTHQIAYRLRDLKQTVFPHQITREFTFLPYAQISEFTLADRLHVTEAFYVPHGPRHERVVSFVIDVTLYNPGGAPLEVALFPWALLVGQRFYGEPEHEVSAWVQGDFICSKNQQTGAQRWWGGSRSPHAGIVALREQVMLHHMRTGSLRPEEHLDEVTPQLAECVSRRIFGALEYRITVPPGARESLRLAVVYHKDGEEKSRPVLEQLLHDPKALHETQRYFASKLGDARFMAPSPAISRGVVWAKANMLRIIKEYPNGWGSTNSPPSDILVSRDTSWFVHGFDYFLPQFSRDAIEVFNKFVEESGEMIEYVRGVSGFKTSYELNINDDTPLHLIAMLHHYNATLDDQWVRDWFPLICSIADYMLTQRDKNGLLFCRANGVDMFGISSWRNIIPYYTLDGAVTEINAEGVYALEAAAMLAAVVGDNERWLRYSEEAQSLRQAMMQYLYNADTGAFVLNYDQEHNYQDNFTADEVFPVLFNVADADQRRKILDRLCEADFTTPVGLRTISTADSWYFPSHGFGLLGGVWPDLTLWFVMCLARNGSIDAAVHWMEAIYDTMEAGATRNTVPGEFGEWFDGGSLTNRGMYLSPWTGAKYLWAVAETIGGLDGYRTSGRPHLVPLQPRGWKWVAAARVHWGGKLCSYVIDFEQHAIYGNMRELSAEEPFVCMYAGRDVSEEVTTSPVEVGAVAFQDEEGAVRVFLCNLNDQARTVSVDFRGITKKVVMQPGELHDLHLMGKPADRQARAAARDVAPRRLETV